MMFARIIRRCFCWWQSLHDVIEAYFFAFFFFYSIGNFTIPSAHSFRKPNNQQRKTDGTEKSACSTRTDVGNVSAICGGSGHKIQMLIRLNPCISIPFNSLLEGCSCWCYQVSTVGILDCYPVFGSVRGAPRSCSA